MSIKEFIEPTGLKIKSLLILIIGLLIPSILRFFIVIYVGRNFPPEIFQNFVNGWNNLPFVIIRIIIYIIWLYLIISFMININKRTKK